MAGEEKPGGSRSEEDEADDEGTLVEGGEGAGAPGERAAGPEVAGGAAGERRRSSILQNLFLLFTVIIIASESLVELTIRRFYPIRYQPY
jgi:hypothetical protein